VKKEKLDAKCLKEEHGLGGSLKGWKNDGLVNIPATKTDGI